MPLLSLMVPLMALLSLARFALWVHYVSRFVCSHAAAGLLADHQKESVYRKQTCCCGMPCCSGFVGGRVDKKIESKINKVFEAVDKLMQDGAEPAELDCLRDHLADAEASGGQGGPHQGWAAQRL